MTNDGKMMKTDLSWIALFVFEGYGVEADALRAHAYCISDGTMHCISQYQYTHTNTHSLSLTQTHTLNFSLIPFPLPF